MSATIHALNAPTSPSLTPREAYLSSLAPGSRAGQASALALIAALLGREADERLSYADAVRVRGTLLDGDTYAPAYARKLLCALRGVAKQALALGVGDERELRAVESIPGVKGGADKAAGRDLAHAESDGVLSACDDGTIIGVRDGAALALLLCAGLRRAEACGLALADVTLSPEGGSLRVCGKGAKVRTLPVRGELAARLSAYAPIRGSAPGPLLCAVTRGDRLTGEPVSGDAIYQILSRRAALAGVANVRPHDARRTVATRLLNAGADIAAVADVLGHASVDTTRRYDMSRERRVRDTLALLDNGANRATKGRQDEQAERI